MFDLLLAYVVLSHQANSSAVPDHEVKNFELDLTTGGARINGLWFNSSRILESFQIGDVVELTVDGSRLHPVHMHINPMQILSIQSDTNYFQAGDWHGEIK
jgi:FtsP/CotA-like multicopper oxidase with cupredoxin domain